MQLFQVLSACWLTLLAERWANFLIYFGVGVAFLASVIPAFLIEETAN